MPDHFTVCTMRRGFTLIEMLVASMVFITGFVAVFTLFLAGMKFRAQGDLDTRSAMAIRNLSEELQLDAGTKESAGLFKPTAYVGNGLPTKDGTWTASALNDELFACPGLPGMFYRVIQATDGVGDPAGTNPVLNLRVIIVGFASTPPLTWGDLDRRLAIKSEKLAKNSTATTSTTDSQASDQTMTYLISELVRRGIATDNRIAIIKQPSWLHR